MTSEYVVRTVMEMTTSEKHKGRFTKFQIATIVVALLSAMLTFSGLKLQDVTTFISASLSPKVDFTITSLTTPEYIPSDYGRSLTVSPEYIIVTNVGLGSDTVYQGSAMRFSISFENRGKKAMEQSRVLVLIVDPLYRIWGVWNRSSTSDELTRGWSFDYYFPSLDQKIIGTWVIIAHLYDDTPSLPLLVSYEFRMFRVTDDVGQPWWISVVGTAIGLAIGFTTAFALIEGYERLRGRWKKRVKEVAESPKIGLLGYPQ